MKYITTINDVEYSVELLPNDQVSVDGKIYDVDFEEVGDQQIYTLLVSGRSFEAHVTEDEDLWQILIHGALYEVDVIDEREKRLKEAAGEGRVETGAYVLKAPMPGLVVSVLVKVGDTIEAGDVLVILESMKMQNELKAPREGTITRINIAEGDSVEQRQELIALDV